MFSKKLSCIITISTLAVTTLINPVAVGNVDGFMNQTIYAAETSELTVDDMPSYLASSIQWVYTNRMLKEDSVSRQNLIFDQIFDGEGTLNYVVRWQSTEALTLETRQKMEDMLDRQVNNWTQYLKGYDGWPYDHITVKVVGWAVADASQILDKQDDEIVYTDCIYDSLSEGTSIPSQLPCAPSSLSRFDHFTDESYTYPGGLDKRWDMYLWGTTGFSGGAGGDWGQRVSDDYILSTLDNDEVHIIEHEMGHGFGLPDFYEEADRPTGGFPTNTIMWAGDSTTITEWDAWMLRYTWSMLNDDTTRFPEKTVVASASPSAETTPTVEVSEEPVVTSETPVTTEEPVVSQTPSITPVETSTPEVSPSIEVTPDAANYSVSLDAQSNGGVTTNSLAKTFVLKNTGSDSLDVSKIKISYFFTKDSNAALTMYCDNAAVSYTTAPWYTAITSDVVGTFGTVSGENADTYLEVSYENAESVLTKNATLTTGVRVAKEDWSQFDQSNDYSYAGANYVAVYYDGQLIWGSVA